MRKKTVLFILLITSAVLMSCGFTVIPTDGARGKTAAVQPVQTEKEDHQLFLPYVNRYSEITSWGVQLTTLQGGAEMDRMAAAGANWVRGGLIWKTIEPTPGARSWEANLSSEQGLRSAASKGMQVILVVDGTPSWALKPGYTCGAVASEQLQRLGDFMYDSVRRLSVPPYNVKYWELWNEPDVIGHLGCWGDGADPYYGGTYYAEMLKAVYPRIKEADPHAQVLVGGLLLDCDPRKPVPDPSNPSQTKDCKASRFMEGILLNGGGSYFNGVSFHGYDYFTPENIYYNPNWLSTQKTTGPVTLVKANFLRGLLDGAGLYNKYLINTETAVFCSIEDCTASEFIRAKNNYILETYAASLAYNLRSTIWWSAMGFRDSGLLKADYSPEPAYYAYQFTRQKLGRAVYTRQLNQPGILGFEFTVDGRPVWVLRSLDGSPKSVQLANPLRIYQIGDDGQPISLPLSGVIQVGLQPLLIEY